MWQEHDEAGPCWVSGLYKIRFYARIQGFCYGRPGYAAYYIKKGDRCWGYHVNPSEPYYDTLEAAQAACAVHWETVKDERWVQTILAARAKMAETQEAS